MTTIQVDDRVYLAAQDEFDRWEIENRRGGAGEVFWEFLERNGVQDNSEKGDCDAAFGALMAHAKGDYRAIGAKSGERGDELRRLVWSFHRAWIDRYGWTHAIPKNPDDA